MKTLKMLMMAALTILTISVSAQNNTSISQQEQLTKSKKELMKMEVMKIQTSPKDFATTGTLKNSTVSNLSSKEQMKAGIMKLNNVAQNYSFVINKSGKCAACLKLSNLSPKEQMKMKVMLLDTCPMSTGTPDHEADKCAICGMDLTACK